MFRTIRRKKNEISIDASKNLLGIERRGVIAFNGEDEYPYAIPINYLYCEKENKIYFHGARQGYKVDLLKKC
ncbi:MAG: pyridoxamine 5'-phosphate oxidase family protein, partial [Ruminococcus sp.]|nr:pyridoxamine 5'-phosphate oxidase family protein [Candidatus Copronaster equi]